MLRVCRRQDRRLRKRAYEMVEHVPDRIITVLSIEEIYYDDTSKCLTHMVRAVTAADVEVLRELDEDQTTDDLGCDFQALVEEYRKRKKMEEKKTSAAEMADGIRTPDNTTAYRSLVEVRTALALSPPPIPLPTRVALPNVKLTIQTPARLLSQPGAPRRERNHASLRAITSAVDAAAAPTALVPAAAASLGTSSASNGIDLNDAGLPPPINLNAVAVWEGPPYGISAQICDVQN